MKAFNELAYTLSEKIQVYPKVKNFPLKLCPKNWTLKFANAHQSSPCCQLSSAKVDAQRDKMDCRHSTKVTIPTTVEG